MAVFLKELGYMTEDNIWSNKQKYREEERQKTVNPTWPFS